MYLPMQSEPVQRTIPGQPLANSFNGATSNDRGSAGGQGVEASQYGVEPSIDWGKLAGGLLNTLPGLISLF